MTFGPPAAAAETNEVSLGDHTEGIHINRIPGGPLPQTMFPATNQGRLHLRHRRGVHQALPREGLRLRMQGLRSRMSWPRWKRDIHDIRNRCKNVKGHMTFMSDGLIECDLNSMQEQRTSIRRSSSCTKIQ